MAQNQWNADSYIRHHGFVYEYGADLVELLSPQPGETILDLGCGTGDLTQRIAQSGAAVEGADLSPEMIEKARSRFPHLPFRRENLLELDAQCAYDAIHSNAVLHWVEEEHHPRAAANLFRALKPGGRFVAEFGGYGNCRAINDALGKALRRRHVPDRLPFYFPTVGQYATVLENAGLQVDFSALFQRPTPLQGCEGLRNWLRMFHGALLAPLAPEEQEAALAETETMLLERGLYSEDGNCWNAEYVRLRVRAVKPV